jgi:hypothetical protein
VAVVCGTKTAMGIVLLVLRTVTSGALVKEFLTTYTL